MELYLSPVERSCLRDLAARQAEIASLPVMEARRAQWTALNDGDVSVPPPVVIETWTFDRDFLPGSLLRCASETGRGIERQLLANIRNHEMIDDDKVIPGEFRYGWRASIDRWGVEIPRRVVRDSQGEELGFEQEHPIKDIDRDFEKLQPPSCRVDREATSAYAALLDDLLGDLLPPRLATGHFGDTMLTQAMVTLMGMEAYFLAMYDNPDGVHRLMAYLRDNALAVMRWAEHEGLLRVNNGNEASFGSSYNFTTELPAPGHVDPAARLCDLFGSSNSQETVGIAPSMFHEFCFPYYRDVCEPFGLLYWGCCEPANPFWDDLSRLPHLKKVSISRWADEAFMGEALRGTGVIYSRKPHPNFLGVEVELDEAGWRHHIRATLDATRGVGVEFIVRDVYTVHGNLNKPRRAVEIAREEISQAGR